LFCFILKQLAITSLNIAKSFVFITEIDYVYCAIRTENLNNFKSRHRQ